MAASTRHVRSSSLPSNAHPLVASVEEQLNRLKASEDTFSSSISHRLGGNESDISANSEKVAVVSMLREVEEISLEVFGSLLSFLCLPKPRSKPSGWSILSQFLHSKRAPSPCEKPETSEAEKLDAELILMKSGKHIELVQVQKVLKGLEAFPSTIKETEKELECVFRRLLKTRVSLLNIPNH
ncbi:hypothetical protein PTKIN_Ptkin09bG0096800 [Pterospermum kingtungense]